MSLLEHLLAYGRQDSLESRVTRDEILSVRSELITHSIPSDWNLELRAHYSRGPGQGYCGAINQRRNHRGPSYACLSGNGVISGGGYSFLNRKRDAIAGPEQKCVKPNEVGFADGVRYDLTLLDEAAADKILEIAGANGSSADVPAEFDAGKIVA